MREREHAHRVGQQQETTEDTAVVGKSTLAERHAMAGPAPASAMFDEPVEWEHINEPALPEPEAETARAAAPPPRASESQSQSVAPPPDAAAVTPGDDPEAKETIYGDQHRHPHKGKFERRKKRVENRHPKTDRYNQGDIKSDKTTGHVAGRPGVVINDHGHKNGVFRLKHAHATRYLFVKHGNQNIAEPFDTVDRADFAKNNYRAHGKEHDAKGRKKRLLLNPSMPRKLVINGKAETCVLSWIDGMTAAWIPIHALAGDTSKILRAVRHRAADWDPHRVSNDPHELAKKSKHYVIRNDSVGRATDADDGRVLDAGAKNGDNVTHYLSKDLRKPGFDAGGKKLGKNITRSIVAICMNLPEPHVPPVAIDTAQAGQSFFVMRAKTFHREVPVFENGKHRANILQRWVFGHLGMSDAHGKLVPDPSRRGWVPLRVLAEAAHLKTHEIEPRQH